MSAAAPALASPSEIRRWLWNRWADDPVEYGNDVFESKPREWQPEALAKLADPNVERLAIKSCRDAGKTRLAAYAGLWWLTTHPNSLVITNAPTWRQIRESVWVEIRSLWQNSILPMEFPAWEMSLTKLATTAAKWRAVGVGSNKPAKIEGLHAESVLVIYDEAKIIPNEIYESMQGMLTDVPWKELAISTPGIPSGWFYQAFTKHRRYWHTMTITGDKIPRLLPKYLKERERLGPTSPWFRQYWKAEFAGADEGAVIPLESIEAAVGRSLRVRAGWRRVLGVDPAGQGQDETIVTGRFGPVVIKQWCWQGWREMRTVGEIVKIFRSGHYETVIVDQPGLGGPIIDRLREVLGDERVLGFNPGARPPNDEQYENLKTECAFGLRERFLDPSGESIAIPDDPVLIGQLSSYISTPTSRGRTKLQDPPDSPDRADSLLIAFSDALAGADIVTGSPAGL